MTTTRLPEAKIEDVILCPSDLSGCQLYEIWYRAPAGLNVLLAYSRNEAAPEVGGTLLREQGRSGGLTLIWVDAANTQGGLGYDEDGLPESFGKPTPPSIGMTDKQRRMFGLVE